MEDGLDILIADLRCLKGAAFWQQLALIADRPEFKQIEENIYCAIGPQSPDFERLLDAARKAVSFGYSVYILPNPKGVKSKVQSSSIGERTDSTFSRRQSYG